MAGTSGLDFSTLSQELTYWLGNVAQAFKGGQAGSGENGYDFSMPEGTPVYAIDSGKVVGVGVYGGGGVVAVQTSSGDVLYYQHLLVNQANVGDTIGAGEQIGLSGGLHKPLGSGWGAQPGGPGYEPVTCCSNFSHIEFGINAPFGGFWNPNNVGGGNSTNPITLLRVALQTFKLNDIKTGGKGVPFGLPSGGGGGTGNPVSDAIASAVGPVIQGLLSKLPAAATHWLTQWIRGAKAALGILMIGTAVLLVVFQPAAAVAGPGLEVAGVVTGQPELTAIGGGISSVARKGRGRVASVSQPGRQPTIPGNAPPTKGAKKAKAAPGGPAPGVPPIAPVFAPAQPPRPGAHPAGPLPPLPVLTPTPSAQPKPVPVLTPTPPAQPKPVPVLTPTPPAQPKPVPVLTPTPTPPAAPVKTRNASGLGRLTKAQAATAQRLQGNTSGTYDANEPYNLIANKESPLPGGTIAPRRPFVPPTKGMPVQPSVPPDIYIQRGWGRAPLERPKQAGFVYNPPREPLVPRIGPPAKVPRTREQVLEDRRQAGMARLRRDMALNTLGLTEEKLTGYRRAEAAAEQGKREIHSQQEAKNKPLADVIREMKGLPPLTEEEKAAKRVAGTGPATLEEEQRELRGLQELLHQTEVSITQEPSDTEREKMQRTAKYFQEDIVKTLARIAKLENQ